MFTRIEALNYRCLRYVNQPLDAFHVLVGPNGSGKSTFLDVIAFLADLVTEGLDVAIANRANDLRDLFWSREGDCFELAVEARFTDPPSDPASLQNSHIFRYEVVIGVDESTGEHQILREVGSLLDPAETGVRFAQLQLFPTSRVPPPSLTDSDRQRRGKSVFSKKPGQLDNFYPETRKVSGSGGWVPSFKLGPKRSTLANLPEDETRFPVAMRFKNFLTDGVQRLVLNSGLIRQASPPGHGKGYRPDGSTIPWVVHNLIEKHTGQVDDWIRHLQSVLPDLRQVASIERKEDRHRYLQLTYGTGVSIPSWLVSDGTLRLMALTLLAYIPGFRGVVLVEEPENGIHPRAVETLVQSLSSVYQAQVLLATHSPVILSMVEPSRVLCFAKTDSGETDIVRGDYHPRLRDWKGEENLGVLFAGGVLS